MTSNPLTPPGRFDRGQRFDVFLRLPLRCNAKKHTMKEYKIAGFWQLRKITEGKNHHILFQIHN